MEKEYYCLVQDNDSHWYVIPARNQKAWEDFMNIPEDDERSWQVPEWAKEVGGSYSLVVFSDYDIK